MKKNIFKLIMVLVLALTVTSCGAQFNTVGIKVGNLENGAKVTSQDKITYYIYDGDLYKTESVNEEGRCIIQGDLSNVNVVGDKVFYYDNEISTICRSNSEGDRIHRIAEVYTNKFVVSKDNVYAEILTGQGSEDVEDIDNHSVVKMKVTEGKVTSTMPQVIIEKARIIGCIGDYIYVEKKIDGKRTVVKADYTGEEVATLMTLPENAQVIGGIDGFYVMGTVQESYGIYKFGIDGTMETMVTKVDKKTTGGSNVFNMTGDAIYYENYVKSTEDGKTTVKDNVIKMSLDGKEKTTVLENSQTMTYDIAAGADGVIYTAKSAFDLDTIPQWKVMK